MPPNIRFFAGFRSSLAFRYSVTFMVRFRKFNSTPPLFGLSSFLRNRQRQSALSFVVVHWRSLAFVYEQASLIPKRGSSLRFLFRVCSPSGSCSSRIRLLEERSERFSVVPAAYRALLLPSRFASLAQGGSLGVCYLCLRKSRRAAVAAFREHR